MPEIIATLRGIRGWQLPAKSLAVALAIAALRAILDVAGAEGITVSPLVATIITANVFIVGFLLSGVLTDYKESEKLPGELAISLGVVADEAMLLWRHQQAAAARDCLAYAADLVAFFKRWFCRLERTAALTDRISGLGDQFVAIAPLTQPNYIVRLKQEQTALLRAVMRIHTIRETSFVASGYIMVRMATALVVVGLLAIKIDPWWESMFLVGVIAWFLTYLILLIEDLDNPFDYAEDGTPRGQEVSLKPLDDLQARLAAYLATEPAVAEPAEAQPAG